MFITLKEDNRHWWEIILDFIYLIYIFYLCSQLEQSPDDKKKNFFFLLYISSPFMCDAFVNCPSNSQYHHMAVQVDKESVIEGHKRFATRIYLFIFLFSNIINCAKATIIFTSSTLLFSIIYCDNNFLVLCLSLFSKGCFCLIFFYKK